VRSRCETPVVDIDQQIERVRTEGEALARAVEAGPLDAAVPGCPGWDVDGLVRHIGDVHRWAATIVRERIPERLQRDFEGPVEPDALLVWYLEGCVDLVDVLEAASPDDTFWFWGTAPNALAFWARRQANETAIHRCDAESAHGQITPLTTVDAVDALDEWVGLATRRAKAPVGNGRILRLVPLDAHATWSVILGERVAVSGDAGRADCELRGTASDLYLWSMNRRGTDGLTATGDDSLLQAWTDNIKF
jgi:uncharacterized protein (TIGR03083 family)